jgi:hypothetical protein
MIEADFPITGSGQYQLAPRFHLVSAASFLDIFMDRILTKTKNSPDFPICFSLGD